jgi:hypothetical protein
MRPVQLAQQPQISHRYRTIADKLGQPGFGLSQNRQVWSFQRPRTGLTVKQPVEPKPGQPIDLESKKVYHEIGLLSAGWVVRNLIIPQKETTFQIGPK